ncbi:MAG: YeeE/YedE family protein [Candidatus Marinimicrobia bacterium]|nr:YeeE/YedE family protein [Candidatus Neomarinimicrobiota bacterium]
MEVTLWEFIWSLILGMGFGISLQKTQLTKYSTIVNVFRFKDLTVIKFMLTVLITAMPLIFFMRDAGMVSLANVNPTYFAGNFFGGMIFGVGMAAAGFCPGTVAGGIGQGSLDYLIPGGLGFMVGAYLFGDTYTTVFTKLSSIGNIGQVTIPTWLNVNHWLVIIFFVQMTLVLFYFLEKKAIK